MKINLLRYFPVILLAALIMAAGCTRVYYQPTDYEVDTRKYDTASPFNDISGSLNQAFDSIKRIMVISQYTTYVFNPEDNITVRDVKGGLSRNVAASQFNYDDTKSGTATVISISLGNVALLTAAHVVTVQDTIYHYAGEFRGPDAPLKSVAIKWFHRNVIYDMPSLGSFEVLASDREKDLALLGVSFIEEGERLPRALRNSLGRPEDLVLGSFVYVLGYPQGYQMVNTGLVSEPNRDAYAGFVTNTLFNPGISGSPIFARRSADSEFEMVGLARGAQAKTEYQLVPDLSPDIDYEPYVQYWGDTFVAEQRRIYYGITQSISANEIRVFLRENHHSLLRHGFMLTRWASDI